MRANELLVSMNEDVTSLFLRIRGELEVEDLEQTNLRFLLCEHAIFSKQNAVFLEQACLRSSSIPALAAELRRNVDEELGRDVHGEHHYELYVRALWSEVGIDVRGYSPTRHTCAFVGRMLDLSTAPQVEVICGAIFASEAVAVPELELMRVVASTYAATAMNKKIGASSDLRRFYDMHLSGLEQAHRDGLAEFVANHDRYGLDLARLKGGFDAAVTSMATWWKGLASEVRESRFVAA